LMQNPHFLELYVSIASFRVEKWGILKHKVPVCFIYTPKVNRNEANYPEKGKSYVIHAPFLEENNS
ncbi:MAG: hypothetical protein ACO1OC_04695, partial [Tuberibacillus sp.]